jgi:hypothetical protein
MSSARTTAANGAPALAGLTRKYAIASHAPYAIAAGNPASAYARAISAIAQNGVRFRFVVRLTIHKSAG